MAPISPVHGQIYLLDNPLLREPLRPEHIKPRLLGHWGTSPGLNFIYVHLNRIIKSRDLNVIYICGPGHGGPAMVANTYLEGTYSEIYPEVTQDVAGSFVSGQQSNNKCRPQVPLNRGGAHPTEYITGVSAEHAYKTRWWPWDRTCQRHGHHGGIRRDRPVAFQHEPEWPRRD
jgi:phosphoketolase